MLETFAILGTFWLAVGLTLGLLAGKHLWGIIVFLGLSGAYAILFGSTANDWGDGVQGGIWIGFMMFIFSVPGLAAALVMRRFRRKRVAISPHKSRS